MTLELLRNHLNAIHIGAPKAIDQLLACLVAQGHCLVQGLPGLGKTRLLRELAKSLDLNFKRIQGTPDLMPSDITGCEVYHQKKESFEFEHGPIFSDICLFDELNRATPRTQSALLQAMEERQVSVGKKEHSLSKYFFLIATQNPIETEGTFRLPEAQLDRFLIRIDLKMPETDALIKILSIVQQESKHLISPENLTQLKEKHSTIAIANDLVRQTAEWVSSTHKVEAIKAGASPRAAQAIISFAKGLALIEGQSHVSPDNLNEAIIPCLRHRLTLKHHFLAKQNNSDELLESMLNEKRIK